MKALSSLFYRQYHVICAVRNISFRVEQGEIVGYIGPNGAGKSTTIKILCGIIVPSSGVVTVNGIVPHRRRHEHAKNIGVVFGQRSQLWWDIPVKDSLTMLRYMYKVPEKQFHQRLDMFRELLDLDQFLHVPVRNLSLGQKMRAEVCAALLHNPPVVYLDEPTIGLDVVAKRKLREIIKEINKLYRTTVILTTHDIGDIEELCPRVIIIDNGEKLYDGPLEGVKQFGGEHETIIMTVEEPGSCGYLKEVVGKSLVSAAVDGNKIVCVYDRRAISDIEILGTVMKATRVIDFRVERKGTEQIIHDIYTNSREKSSRK
jgi:ABC-2 type transport system ATP-binding protein